MRDDQADKNAFDYAAISALSSNKHFTGFFLRRLREKREALERQILDADLPVDGLHKREIWRKQRETIQEIEGLLASDKAALDRQGPG